MRNWEQRLIREGFADGLLDACETYPNVLVCDADLAASTLTRRVAERFPDRFIDFGIAEQGMLATAAGLALTGWRPFVTSYAMFVVGRAWEIARQQLSYGECGVVVVGAHCGGDGWQGWTHTPMLRRSGIDARASTYDGSGSGRLPPDAQSGARRR